MYDRGNPFSFSQDAVVNAISEFMYDPEQITLFLYFRRFADIFENDCYSWNDEKKVSFLKGNWVQWNEQHL